MFSRSTAVFGITTAPGHGLDLTGLRELLEKERHGILCVQTRGISDGSTVAVGGLVIGGPGTVFVHGVCETDVSEAEDLKSTLSRNPSGEFAFVADCLGCVLAARDPLGGRPLYQGTIEGVSAVSTVPALLEALRAAPSPVPPGQLVRLTCGGLESENYAPQIQRKTFAGSLGQAAARLGTLLRESVKLRLENAKRVAVAFSGGVDSSVLATACAKRGRVLLISVSAEGSRDSGAAASASQELGLELHAVKVTRADLDRAISAIPGCGASSVMDRSIAGGFYLASSEARAQGLDTLVAGQGADEIFGGYGRHLEAATSDLSSLKAKLIQELPALEAGLRRDELAIYRGGCDPRFPYADFSIARFALNLPPEFLIAHGQRKVVLRELAKRTGLAPSIAAAPKKAFQYSSGLEDLLAG